MKLLQLMIACLISSACTLSAQPDGFYYGARFGIGSSSIESKGLKQADNQLALMGGLTANYQFNDYFGLTLDMLITSKGAKASGTITDGTDFWGNPQHYSYDEQYQLIFAEIPLMLKFGIGFDNLYLAAFTGPGLDFNVAALESRTYNDASYNEDNGYVGRNMKGVSVTTTSWVYGAGVYVMAFEKEQVFFMDIRSSSNISSFTRLNGKAAFSRYFAVSIGYMF